MANRTSIRHVQQHISGDTVTVMAQRQRVKDEAVDAFLTQNRSTNNDDLRYFVFKLTDKTKKGGFNLGSICDILFEKEDKDGNKLPKAPRRMRLLRGVSTLWVDEQKDLTPEYIRTNHISPRFERGILRVAETDTILLQYLRLHGANVNSGTTYQPQKTTFYEWDSQAIAKQEAALRGKRREAIKIAEKHSYDEVKRHCAYFGILFVNEVTGDIKSEEELRNDYEDYADMNAENFLLYVNSKEVDVTFMVKKALQQNFIDLGKQSNAAHFATGGFICKIPPNSKPVQVLVDFALSNSKEGKDFLDALQQKLS